MLLTTFDNLLIVLFFIFMLWIGYYFSKKVTNMESFYLAGRTLPWSLTVGTIVATWYGASGTIAMVEYGFVYGISIWFLWSFTAHISRIPMALWVGPKVRMTTEMTVPDLLQRMYGKFPAIFGAILMFIFCSQLFEVTALGIIGSTAWGVSALTVAIIIVILTILLAVLGGLMSVAITDMILFWFMCIGMVMVLPFGWNDVGGWSNIIASLNQMNLDPAYLSAAEGVNIGKVLVLIFLALSAYADPTFYQRFTASETPKSARRALLCCLPIWLTFDAALVALGLLTKVKYPELDPGVGYIKMTMEYLPAGLKAMFILGVLGSIISTLDSYYLTAGATLANDIVGRLKKEPLSQKSLISLTRIGAVVTGVLGLVLAFQFDMVAEGWVFLGGLWTASAVVPVVCGLFWPYKKTYMGGCLSMIVGCGVSVLLYFFPIEGIDALLIAFPASFIAFLIGNLFGNDLNKEKREIRNA